MIDPQHPLLRPLPMRLLVVAVPLAGAAYAFATGWVFPGAGLTLLSGWVFRRLFLP
ncbi:MULTISPECIES: hypothetical protein [Paracoccaceae]|uniref:hypothetical protein n=1 Tax=Paracoccaceae TaxID=31989 RepID=UPI0020217ABE|nr:hypothetical protein [Phaeovulum sp. NW3]MCL7464021.1 hypothetical protein [Phaeovulum sp. NW3]